MRLADFSIAVTAILLCPMVQATECEVSLPKGSGLPGSLTAPDGFTWVGTPELAAQVPESGHWIGMGSDHQYGDKWWWWRQGYLAMAEPEPEIEITATRLDGSAPAVHIPRGTNAYGKGWNRILVGMQFPSPGCWEVVANYHGHDLRFIFAVGP